MRRITAGLLGAGNKFAAAASKQKYLLHDYLRMGNINTEVDCERQTSHQSEVETEHQSKPHRSSFFEFPVQDKRGFSAASVSTFRLIRGLTSKKLAPMGLYQFPHSERHQEPAWAARKETSPCQQYGSMHWPRCEGGDRMTVQVIWGRGVKGVMGASLAGTTGPRNTGSHGNGQCRDSTLNRGTRAGDHPKPLHRYSYVRRN